jgi:hypothetical protein
MKQKDTLIAIPCLSEENTERFSGWNNTKIEYCFINNDSAVFSITSDDFTEMVFNAELPMDTGNKIFCEDENYYFRVMETKVINIKKLSKEEEIELCKEYKYLDIKLLAKDLNINYNENHPIFLYRLKYKKLK